MPDGLEVETEEAVAMAVSGISKIVWMGDEPVSYIAQLLCIDESLIAHASLREMYAMGAAELEEMSGMIFTCYHGITSMRAAEFLQERGVKAYSLRGGVTTITGEIF